MGRLVHVDVDMRPDDAHRSPQVRWRREIVRLTAWCRCSRSGLVAFSSVKAMAISPFLRCLSHYTKTRFGATCNCARNHPIIVTKPRTAASYVLH